MAETKTKPTGSSYTEQAKVALDGDTRNEAQVDVLASQLEQQDKARGDVSDAQEPTNLAAHTAEGGGAWPQEQLVARYTTPIAGFTPAFAPEQNYTSHEGAKK